MYCNLILTIAFKVLIKRINKYNYIFVFISEFKNIPYIGYYKLTTPAIVLRDSDLIKNVLIEDYKHFAENDLPIIEKYDPLIKINPFSLIDERWRRARNIMVPTMTAGKV